VRLGDREPRRRQSAVDAVHGYVERRPAGAGRRGVGGPVGGPRKPAQQPPPRPSS
jgi:hypothetical protein